MTRDREDHASQDHQSQDWNETQMQVSGVVR